MFTDIWMDKEVVVHIYNAYYSAIKRNKIVRSSEVDEPRVCQTEWSKSEREKQMLYFNIYMESRKMVLMNRFTGQEQRDTDIKNKLVSTVGEGKGGKNWEISINIHILPCIK